VWYQVRGLEFDPRDGVDFWEPDKDGKPVDEPKLLGHLILLLSTRRAMQD
jgi:hypothetical protein